ncbi:MAG: tetratricopeptide repeat protein, partial [Chloroflexi bacterium]|nr:tetratricopeptide repeat protein [Chloroflexota bacterium]
MPELRTLIEEARAALVAGNARRALTVCEHVLARYPKHLEASCLAAEALRELDQRDAARDRFLRVLSADPENVIAYWGLSILFEQKDDLDGAIWGLDRALSLSPGHRELSQELSRLTGEEPQLTRAALARLRLRNGWYDQAAAEARAVLTEEPHRLDIQALLAEALWRAGRDDEAIRVCRDLLDDAPDCLKANLILGSSFLRRSRAASSDAEQPGDLTLRDGPHPLATVPEPDPTR